MLCRDRFNERHQKYSSPLDARSPLPLDQTGSVAHDLVQAANDFVRVQVVDKLF